MAGTDGGARFEIRMEEGDGEQKCESQVGIPRPRSMVFTTSGGKQGNMVE